MTLTHVLGGALARQGRAFFAQPESFDSVDAIAAFLLDDLRASGVVIFESREALTAALALAMSHVEVRTMASPTEPGPQTLRDAAAIAAHMLLEADHA